MKVEIVTIGDELLLGFTTDTNATQIARDLGSIGVEIVRRATVGDRADDIALAVRDAIGRSEGVVTTGGLGPTSDDLTKAAIAELFGRQMVRDESVVAALHERWKRVRRSGPLPASNLAQAMLPEGSEVLANEHGTAPGVWLEDADGRWVAMLPGVPREMKAMLQDALLPRLVQRMKATSLEPTVVRSHTVRTTGIAESALVERLGPLASGVDGIPLAFIPGLEGVDLRLTVRGVVPEAADSALRSAGAEIRRRLGDYAYGVEDEDLAAVVLERCRERGLTLAVAESCTAGLLGARVTSVAGSSDVFFGGIIAYDNNVKRELLGVSDADLERHGAVSERVANAMARSVRARLGAGIGVAITGVAGPGGGTREKPVGTVWVAVDGPSSEARCLRLFGSREEIRQRAAQGALDMVRRVLSNG